MFDLFLSFPLLRFGYLRRVVSAIIGFRGAIKFLNLCSRVYFIVGNSNRKSSRRYQNLSHLCVWKENRFTDLFGGGLRLGFFSRKPTALARAPMDDNRNRCVIRRWRRISGERYMYALVWVYIREKRQCGWLWPSAYHRERERKKNKWAFSNKSLNGRRQTVPWYIEMAAERERECVSRCVIIYYDWIELFFLLYQCTLTRNLK